LKEAKGEILLIVQCDIEFGSKSQISRMLDIKHDNNVVTELFFKDGRRDCGMYLQCCMVSKKHMEQIGGWHEGFSGPDMCAHEDADVMASLLELGLDLDHTETPKDHGVFHLDHPRPDYEGDPNLIRRLANAKKLFWSRHKQGVMDLYAKQMVRRMVARRMNVH